MWGIIVDFNMANGTKISTRNLEKDLLQMIANVILRTEMRYVQDLMNLEKQ
jgi:hypothetical protein